MNNGITIFAKFLKEMSGVEFKDEDYFSVTFNKGDEVWGFHVRREELGNDVTKGLKNLCEDAINKYKAI